MSVDFTIETRVLSSKKTIHDNSGTERGKRMNVSIEQTVFLLLFLSIIDLTTQRKIELLFRSQFR